jgi:hypothetical protein
VDHYFPVEHEENLGVKLRALLQPSLKHYNARPPQDYLCRAKNLCGSSYGRRSMRIKLLALSVALIACGAIGARAQQSATTQPAQAATEQRVQLTETAIAFDTLGRTALAGRLRTTALSGALDAPVRNVQLVIENRSTEFFTYVSGWATFYDAAGVRCGEGLFKVDALAPAESAETDSPGLRLTCAPSAWRLTATNLLTRLGDAAKPFERVPPLPSETSTPPAVPSDTTSAPLFVNLTIEGNMYRVPLGSTLVIPVNNKRTRITVSASPQ